MRGALAAVLSASALLGCADDAPPSEPPATDLVVGVTPDLLPGVSFDAFDVELRAGGAVVLAETRPADTLATPAEIRFGGLGGGERVELTLTSDSGVVRRGATDAVAGRVILFRAALEGICAGGGNTASCAPELTCVAGSCRDPYVAPWLLEDYRPDWASAGPPDACTRADGAPPVVVVGEGQADYLPMDDLAEAQVEAGPQGGHHVWVAIRMKGLRQSGSITEVRGVVPDLGLDLEPFSVIFTFDPDEGGYCTLHGLRYQLDQSTPIEELLGARVDLTVTVRDPEGTVGVGTKPIVLSPTIL